MSPRCPRAPPPADLPEELHGEALRTAYFDGTCRDEAWLQRFEDVKAVWGSDVVGRDEGLRLWVGRSLVWVAPERVAAVQSAEAGASPRAELGGYRVTRWVTFEDLTDGNASVALGGTTAGPGGGPLVVDAPYQGDHDVRFVRYEPDSAGNLREVQRATFNSTMTFVVCPGRDGPCFEGGFAFDECSDAALEAVAAGLVFGGATYALLAAAATGPVGLGLFLVAAGSEVALIIKAQKAKRACEKVRAERERREREE